MNVKNCVRRNVRKHRDINCSDEYVTLEISLKFDNLDKMRVTSLESKVKLGRSGKELITSLSLKAKQISKKRKKARYAIRNVSKKDRSKIIREFEKLTYNIYKTRRPKHDPTDS